MQAPYHRDDERDEGTKGGDHVSCDANCVSSLARDYKYGDLDIFWRRTMERFVSVWNNAINARWVMRRLRDLALFVSDEDDPMMAES